MKEVRGTITMYSKDKGSIQLDGKDWFSPAMTVLKLMKDRCNSGEVRKTFLATLKIDDNGCFTDLVVSNPADMTTKEYVSKLGGNAASVQVPVNKFNNVVLNEENYAEVLKKGKLLVKLAKELKDEYQNLTSKTNLSDTDIALIDSVLKATIWK